MISRYHQFAALDIPETGAFAAARAREEKRTLHLFIEAKDRLALTRPHTVSGVVAALAYFIEPDNGFIGYLDDTDSNYLKTMIGRLVELFGAVPDVG